MKPQLLSLLLLGAGNAFGQEAPSFKDAGAPFVPADGEIAWMALTNQIPKALWIYKTIPQHFSDKAISNLVALGGVQHARQGENNRRGTRRGVPSRSGYG